MLCIRYVRSFRRLPNVIRPTRFTEFVLAKLLFDRDQRLTVFADKFAVRDYVARTLGSRKNSTTVFAVAHSSQDTQTLDLPDRFVMKPTHLSGAVKIVTDLSAIDRTGLVPLAESWLRRNLWYERGEWAYKNIPPCILFEELLDEDGKPPTDYRFFCFGGEPRMISVTRDFLGPNATSSLYDPDFKLLPVRHVGSPRKHLAVQMDPPPNFAEMLDIARKLSRGVDFVRVDLYNIKGRIVFGELTNYPAGGLRKYDPPSFDETLGSYWPQKSP
jgi:hypothetical protein